MPTGRKRSVNRRSLGPRGARGDRTNQCINLKRVLGRELSADSGAHLQLDPLFGGSIAREVMWWDVMWDAQMYFMRSLSKPQSGPSPLLVQDQQECHRQVCGMAADLHSHIQLLKEIKLKRARRENTDMVLSPTICADHFHSYLFIYPHPRGERFELVLRERGEERIMNNITCTRWSSTVTTLHVSVMLMFWMKVNCKIDHA